MSQNSKTVAPSENKFQIQWFNINYTVRYGALTKFYHQLLGQRNTPSIKHILRNVSGSLSAGEMSAILGPSGAGKSTLLNIIMNICRKGVSGKILFDGDARKIEIAYIPQNDKFFDILTVKECLQFASILKNTTKEKSDETYRAPFAPENDEISQNYGSHRLHAIIAKNVATLLGLEDVLSTRVKNLSGGQRKRLSIAQEIVSYPDVLILDEPTSGLDSTTAFRCIEILQNLTKQSKPITVLCTIHQPSVKIFNMFDQVYILSCLGKCIYHGKPAELVKYMKEMSIECPLFYNPADFIIELAAGEYGKEIIEKMVVAQERKYDDAQKWGMQRKLKKLMKNSIYPKWQHFSVLLRRSFLLIRRDYQLMTLRFFSHIVFSLFLCYVFGTKSGQARGCIEIDKEITGDTAVRAIRDNVVELKAVGDNFSLILITYLMIALGAMMPVVISFPHQIQIATKEMRNKWYSIHNFFFSILLSDLPFQIIFPTLYISLTYVLTEQAPDLWRFYSMLFVSVNCAFISHSFGMIAGLVFMQNLYAVIYLCPSLLLTLLLFSGFLIRLSTMPEVAWLLTHLSFLRYVFEAALVSLYGFGRCPQVIDLQIKDLRNKLSTTLFSFLRIFYVEKEGDYPVEQSYTNVNVSLPMQNAQNMTEALVETILAGSGVSYLDENNHVISIVLYFYDLRDSDLYYAHLIIILHVILMRVISYLFMIWRASK
ncbi:ATP-binding cassette sub-family G member 1-like protein [Dinothrombium tinctorium]|uniref:ATP-binding cassette sub-family G member 1-like protein n=1 Tax=Dinothrombium tinctorium TaxID=1965070 RepID=A0A443QUH2_9ACAR|nr:ATP-binding cassette sub-family G member 1-like protein [Dinothrombium tinctorium]